MTAREAIEKLGGQTKVAKRYGYKVGTVGAWTVRGFPAKVLLSDRILARDLKRAGYDYAATPLWRKR